MKIKNILFVLLVVLAACTKTETKPEVKVEVRTPEETLRKFVEVSAAANQAEDKLKLERLCHGEMKRAFDRMTDEIFQISYLNSKIKIVRLNILDSKIEKPSATIRYQVELENEGGTDPTTELNEREMEFTFVDGNWFIEAIKTVGTDKLSFTNGMIL